MQDINKIKEKQPLQPMSTQDALGLILEVERLEKIRRENRKDKEERDDFFRGEVALENAAYNDVDDDTVTTGTGKIIVGRGSKNRHHTIHNDKDPYGVKALAEALTAMALSTALIEQWAKRAFAAVSAPVAAATSSLSGKFDDKSKDMLFADAEFIYEAEDVSAETARLLNNRMARILREQKELQSITDPVEYAALKDALDRLIERSDVRFHERVGFAFEPEKVTKIEKFLDPESVDCSGMVCVFKPRAATHDSRRMKIDVADQYDQDPTETIGEAKVETPQNVAPPEFHFIR